MGPDVHRDQSVSVGVCVCVGVGVGVSVRVCVGASVRVSVHTALGSAGEVLACYDTAEAMRYTDPVGRDVRGRVDHVIGTLVNVLRLRR